MMKESKRTKPERRDRVVISRERERARSGVLSAKGKNK
jgi:hypothetical protein